MPRDLGNRSREMTLTCNAGKAESTGKRCRYTPPDGMRLGEVQRHYQAEHGTDEVTFDLVVKCSCGGEMAVTDTRPTGGGVKDYVLCGDCGNTGFIKRDPWMQVRAAGERGEN